MKTYDLGNDKLVEMADVAYLFSNRISATDDYGSSDDSASESVGYSTAPEAQTVNGVKIVAEGTNNDIPIQLRNFLDSSHLGSGALARIKGMVFAQGVALYEPVYTKDAKTGKAMIIREWKDDSEISEWLLSFNADKYIMNIFEDLFGGAICYTKLYRNVGGRISTGKINFVEHVPAISCRREWPGPDGKVVRIWTGDWTGSSTEEKTLGYSRFDPLKPLRPTMMDYSMFYRFGMSERMPALPQWWGARKWIKRGSDIPTILENLINNSLNIKWHIISPAEYWEEKGDKLKKRTEAAGKVYHEKILEDFKETTLKSLANVLKGIKNVGAFFHSESVCKVLDIGKAEVRKWEIEPIDMKVKDYIDAQLKIADKADQATTSGMGIPPSLSNIIIGGRVASGSEELYAYKLFAANDTYIPELIAFEVLNKVIRYNFPSKANLRAGIYRDVVMKEQDVNPTERTKENV